jgi:hypothetical protein
LNNKYGLKANQTLANVSINWKTTIVFFFTQVKCTVSGDLIEFTNNGIGNQSSNAMSSQESIGITTIIKPSSEEIAKQKSDSIMNKQSVDKMKKIADANIVKQSKKDSIERHSKLPAYEKFKTLYKVGDQFNFVDPTTENMINGIITEINLDNIVIEYGTQKRKKQLKIKDIQI